MTKRTKIATLLMTGAMLAATSGAVLAHHSFAMFNVEEQLELDGTVVELKFTNPHTFIVLKLKDGTVWNLEGTSPTGLTSEGWTRTSLNPGDEIHVKVAPLRSGAPGGRFLAEDVKFQDGKPVVKRP